jgi:hypothetical protein
MRAARRATKQRFYDLRHVQVLHDQEDGEGEREDTHHTLEKVVRSKDVRRDE